MTVTVGLIYQESPQQLCLYYLTDAQKRAGRGIVIVAALGTLLWCVHALRAVGLATSNYPLRCYPATHLEKDVRKINFGELTQEV